MLQNDNVALFHSLLKDFHELGILDDFILIGSWVLRVFQEHFNYDPRIPIVATQDVDFLLENPVRISKSVDIGEILSRYGFQEEWSVSGEYGKFIGPSLDVEFLFPDKGKGTSGGITIAELGVVAQPLRYLHFIQDYSVTLNYQTIPVRVPEPVVFVLMKYLLTKKRSNAFEIKIAKDVSTAKGLESFLLDYGAHNDFRDRFSLMPGNWQKELKYILRKHKSELVDVLG